MGGGAGQRLAAPTPQLQRGASCGGSRQASAGAAGTRRGGQFGWLRNGVRGLLPVGGADCSTPSCRADKRPHASQNTRARVYGRVGPGQATVLRQLAPLGVWGFGFGGSDIRSQANANPLPERSSHSNTCCHGQRCHLAAPRPCEACRGIEIAHGSALVGQAGRPSVWGWETFHPRRRRRGARARTRGHCTAGPHRGMRWAEAPAADGWAGIESPVRQGSQDFQNFGVLPSRQTSGCVMYTRSHTRAGLGWLPA